MLIRAKLIPAIEFLLQITWVLRKCNMHTNTHCAMVVDILWNRLGWVSVYLYICISLSLFFFLVRLMSYVRTCMLGHVTNYEKDAKRRTLNMCVSVQWCIYWAKLYIDFSFVSFSFFNCWKYFAGIVFSSAFPMIFLRKEDPNCNFQFEFCMKFCSKQKFEYTMTVHCSMSALCYFELSYYIFNALYQCLGMANTR